MVDTKEAFFFETLVGNFSGGYSMNKTNDFLMIGSYICGLNSKIFLHTDKTFFCVLETIYKCRKAIAFDFESVHVCYFYIDLGMSSLTNKWKPFF